MESYQFPPDPEEALTGSAAEALVRCLEAEGVRYVFGVPGEETLALVEALRVSKIKFIVTRHEQGAGLMACALGRLSKDRVPGVFLATLGPGATNCSTAIAHAFLLGVPVFCVTGQKPIRSSKQGQFQVLDVVDHFHSITKFTKQVQDPGLVGSLVRKSFRIARLEKPGPVHLELPEDIASLSVGSEKFVFPRYPLRRPAPNRKTLQGAADLIRKAKRPLVCVAAAAARIPPVSESVFGGLTAGTQGGVATAIHTLLESTGLMAVATQLGKGVVDEFSPNFIGVTALSENDLVHVAIEAADLIILIGHDTTEKPPFFMHHGRLPVVVHVNFNPATLDEIFFPQLEVVGDIEAAVRGLTMLLSPGGAGPGSPPQPRQVQVQPDWDLGVFRRVKQRLDESIGQSVHRAASSVPLTVQRIVAEVQTATTAQDVVCLDTGMFKIWFAREFRVARPGAMLMDNALASMGVGLPTAIGAALAMASESTTTTTVSGGKGRVLAICGDGGFLMNSQEMETAVRLQLHLTILVLNDGQYGMIRWKQEKEEKAEFGMGFGNPDFVKYAQAYGARGYRVTHVEDLGKYLHQALTASGGVHLIEVPVNYASSTAFLEGELEQIVEKLRAEVGAKQPHVQEDPKQQQARVPASPEPQASPGESEQQPSRSTQTPPRPPPQSPPGESEWQVAPSRVVQRTSEASPWLQVVEPGQAAEGASGAEGGPEIKAHYSIYIGGSAVQTTQKLEVLSKYDGFLVSVTSEASEELIRQAIEVARRAQTATARTSLHERVAVLDQLANELTRRKEEIARVIALEAGKPIKDARVEVERGVEVCRIGIAELYASTGEYRRMDYTVRGEKTEMLVKRYPLGVVAMIAPWNFPLNLVLHKVVPAIVAGCPWVLKPSSQTPISALILGEILSSVPQGLPQGSWSIVPASREAADALVVSDQVRVLSFTGSPAVGWALKKRVPAGTRVLLELGGNAACIVEDFPAEGRAGTAEAASAAAAAASARGAAIECRPTRMEFEAMIRRIVMGGFYQAGQSCIHLQRLLVRRPLYREVVGALLSEVRKLTIGDPLEEATFVGPVISDTECGRIEGWVEEAVREGGRKLIGGRREGNIYPPTILENVAETSKVWEREIFGPVVCVGVYDHFEEAIEVVNKSKYGIHCGVYVNDVKKVFNAFDQLEVAGLVVNDVPSVRLDAMPYGGVKESGIGREGVRYAVEELTELKTMLIRR